MASMVSDYNSVVSLDKYGNSIQLQYAQEGASRYGMPIVAATYDGGVMVVALRTSKPGIVSTKSIIIELSCLSPRMGLACTGIKADVRWLVSKLREKGKSVWETYDLNGLSRKRTQDAIKHALLVFLGYSRDKELHDGLVVDSEENWARPLGVLSMMLSHEGPITVIDPSGAAQHFMARAIGQSSKALNEKLEERYKENLTPDEIKTILIDIMKETFEQVNEDSEFIIETLTSHGVSRSEELSQ
jgi:20S proteasome alpha/beta subunit